MRQPIVRAGSDGTAPYRSRHYLPFRWLHFLSCGPPEGRKRLAACLFFARSAIVRGRLATISLAGKMSLSSPPSFDREGEKKFTKETIKECFSNDLELFVGDNNVFPRFFIARFISFFIYRDKSEYSLKFSDSTNSRKIREICLFGRPPIDISKSRRVPLRHASFNRIHILIRRHCERGQMLVTIRHCIRSFRLS